MGEQRRPRFLHAYAHTFPLVTRRLTMEASACMLFLHKQHRPKEQAMNEQARTEHIRSRMIEALGRYENHQRHAVDLLAQATCDELHQCQEGCERGACECDLNCDCMDADEARELATAEATLAQAAAQAANTWALLLTKD